MRDRSASLKKMKKAFKNKNKILILMVLFFSCKSIKTEKGEIVGKYQWYGIYGVASNITLNKDNTFIYHWQTGLINGTTNGNWKLKGNTLILNSEKQPFKEEDFSIKERNKTSDNHFEVKVIDEEEKYELIFATCILEKDTNLIIEKSTDINGNCILPFVENPDKLKFSYVGYKEVEISTKELTTNSFILEMKEENNYYEYFTNREWKVRKGKIYDPKIRKGKYVKKNYYERIKNRKRKQNNASAFIASKSWLRRLAATVVCNQKQRTEN